MVWRGVEHVIRWGDYQGDVSGALDDVESFPHPILVGASRFREGIDAGWGNRDDTYRTVWNQAGQRGLSSVDWGWSAYGNGDKMSDDETLGNLTSIGRSRPTP